MSAFPWACKAHTTCIWHLAISGQSCAFSELNVSPAADYHSVTLQITKPLGLTCSAHVSLMTGAVEASCKTVASSVS